MKFSANLGFLWTDRPLANAIRAARAAGFDAVECHWPYGESIEDVRSALDETGLPMLGLNTIKGDSNGLSAMPGHETEAQIAIDQGLEYGQQIGAKNLHVMAGITDHPDAHACFLNNLRYASEQAIKAGIGILIEPLNPVDVPGYFLSTQEQARAIVAELGLANVRVMFDCYHVGKTEGDVLKELSKCWDTLGHIQFAGVPDRSEPDQGSVDYPTIFEAIRTAGWDAPLGAEYRPSAGVEEGLGWLTRWQ